MSIASKLEKWVSLNLISAEQAQQIQELEGQNNRSWIFGALGGIGALSIILGFLSIVAANWDSLSDSTKIIGHLLLNLGLASGIFFKLPKPTWLREILVAVLAGLILTFIALMGQILQTQAPLWQPIGLWLLLATPLLFIWARSIWVAKAWIIVVVSFLVLIDQPLHNYKTMQLLWVALPFTLYSLSQIKVVRHTLEGWCQSWEKVFWVALVAFTLFSQLIWRYPFLTDQHRSFFFKGIPYYGIMAACVASAFLIFMNFLSRKEICNFWKSEKKEGDIVLAMSLLFMITPFLVPHTSLPALGAFFFCLYWFFLGVIGLRLGIPRLWSAAVLIICIRLLVAYIEIFGSLAIQGIGFIITGMLLLLLAASARKIIRIKPQWLKFFTGREPI